MPEQHNDHVHCKYAHDLDVIMGEDWGEWIHWLGLKNEIQLDGWFTPEQLRKLADYIERNGR